ncbi:MAG: prepilin-type N-terminal cleavage/methylation domain-containing protein [candidate division NC10 bacterium]|nr:prepilin-type N-terminal cleavage/methylation domain-containing protein [candidate division NC10 bacterium]
MWRSSSRGFTLIEILVAAAISALITVTIYMMFETNQSTFNKGEADTDLQQNARVAMDRLIRELRMAGSQVPTGTTPSQIVPMVLANQTEVRFLADLDNASTSLITWANPGATSITVTSASGFFVNDSFYITDGAKWEQVTATSVNKITTPHTISFTPALSWSYAPRSQVLRSKTIRYSLVCEAPSGETCPPYAYTLKRDGGGGQLHPLAVKISGLTFAYYDANNSLLAAPVASGSLKDIRRITITLTASDTLPREGPRSYALRSEVRPRNLGL